MDPISWLISLVQMVSNIPVVGKYLAIGLAALVGIQALVNSLVAIWHALVSAVSALAGLPGLSGLQALADSLKADSDVIDAGSSKVLALLERLSAIPVPQAPAQTPPAA